MLSIAVGVLPFLASLSVESPIPATASPSTIKSSASGPVKGVFLIARAATALL